MKVFKLNNKSNLQEVDQLSFKLEKNIQDLVEKNTESVFNLKFIQSELSVDKYRIDTLCYDSETNSFVIIEYKKGSSYSVIDQGYTYLQLLLNNKPEFLLVLSQYFNKVLKIDDVDWSQSRIIFVSPSFNSYQKDSVNFKGLPFELWEIKRYSNDTIVLNQHHSNSKESIKTLNPTTNSTISQVSEEVKVVDEEFHTSKLNSNLVSKWDELKDEIYKLDSVEIIPKKSYISLILNGKTLCYLTFRKNTIILEISRGNVKTDGTKSKNYFDIDDPKSISEEGSWEWKDGTKGTIYKIRITKITDLEYLMFLIKQKYNNLVN
jgi:predicted transport protein